MAKDRTGTTGGRIGGRNTSQDDDPRHDHPPSMMPRGGEAQALEKNSHASVLSWILIGGLVSRRDSALQARGEDAEPPGFAQRVFDHGAFFRSVRIGVGLETSPRDRDQPRRARERDGHEAGPSKG